MLVCRYSKVQQHRAREDKRIICSMVVTLMRILYLFLKLKCEQAMSIFEVPIRNKSTPWNLKFDNIQEKYVILSVMQTFFKFRLNSQNSIVNRCENNAFFSLVIKIHRLKSTPYIICKIFAIRLVYHRFSERILVNLQRHSLKYILTFLFFRSLKTYKRRYFCILIIVQTRRDLD